MSTSLLRASNLRKRMRLTPQQTGILDLPDEILENIFRKLPQRDILHNVARVSKRFLMITRMPQFVQTAKIELLSDDEYPGDIANSSIEKVQNISKCYPLAKIELEYEKTEYDEMILMDPLKPFANSVTSFNLRIENSYDVPEDCSSLTCFKNLEKIFIQDPGSEDCIHLTDIEEDFFSNFAELKEIAIMYDIGSNVNELFDFVDMICSNCPKLTSFSLHTFVIGIKKLMSTKYPKVKKFMNITDFHLIMIPIGDIFSDDVDNEFSVEERSAALNDFKNYITAKFPALKRPIKIVDSCRCRDNCDCLNDAQFTNFEQFYTK